ncbi:ARM repeat-containing protein [Wallemia mellicola]|uniref:ARM repeat-containing protein n=1 Tax=Wallemia mellicola TaxID=1708541 RepID=A0AB38MUD4_9BASI|nr:ARM repeat-containing protein [Wallemia mellicola]TIC35874.1 ARM repeat-containing protein [Wallemia mellicola]TIC60182.1 ARM repeat-containing protein [Wallemia mellicola]
MAATSTSHNNNFNLLLPPLEDEDIDEPPASAPLPTNHSRKKPRLEKQSSLSKTQPIDQELKHKDKHRNQKSSTLKDTKSSQTRKHNDSSKEPPAKVPKEARKSQKSSINGQVSTSKEAHRTEVLPPPQKVVAPSKIPKPFKIPENPHTSITTTPMKPRQPQISKHVDISAPMPIAETPAIKANKDLRKSRRSSVGNRGKRSSSWSRAGIIVPPHPDLNSTEFCRHIDEDLPDPRRFRILFEWCRYRACNPDVVKPRRSKRVEESELNEQKMLLNAINNKETVALAQTIVENWVKSLNTNAPPWMPPKSNKEKEKAKNPENEKYKELISKSQETLARLKQEDEIWSKLRSNARLAEQESVDVYNIDASENKEESEDIQLDYLPEGIRSDVLEILNKPATTSKSINQNEKMNQLNFTIAELDQVYHQGAIYTETSDIYTNNVMSHYLKLLRNRLSIDNNDNENENKPDKEKTLPSTLTLAASNNKYEQNDALPLLRAISRPIQQQDQKKVSNEDDDDRADDHYLMDANYLKKLKNTVIGDQEQKRRLASNKDNLEMLLVHISPARLHNQADIDKLVQATLILVPRLIESATVCSCPSVLEYLFRCLRNVGLYYNNMSTVLATTQGGIDGDAMYIDDDLSCKAITELNAIFLSPHLPSLFRHLKSTNKQLIINLLTLLTAANDSRQKASLVAIDGLLDYVVRYTFCDVQKVQIAALKALGILCKDYPPAVMALRQVDPRAIQSLTTFFECKNPQLRLEACVAQQSDFHRTDGPPTIQLISTIDRPKALELIEQLIRLLDESLEIQIPTSFILANILSDATDLEDHACKSDDEYNVEGSQLSRDNLRLQEGILMIVAALALHLDELRTAIVEAQLLKPVAISLKHSAKGIRGSAAQCVRALSRSVGVLRTSLVDSGVELTLLDIISNDEEDERNRVIALMALANLVCGFSPLKQKLIQTGGVKILVKLTYSLSYKVRLNTLWAIKNMVFAASTELKRFVCDQIGWEHFSNLLKDPNIEVVEQVLFVLRNLVTRELDIGLVYNGFGGQDKFLEAIEQKFQTNQVEILLQTAYIINNVATGSDEQKRSLLWRPIICQGLHRLLTHWDERLRAASAWTLRNLTNQTDGQAYRSRIEILTRMRSLEFDKKLATLSEDHYSVSEPARLALDGMNN